MPDEPNTPQNRTDGEDQPDGAPTNTPQGRTEEDDGAEEGRPGDAG